MLNRKLLEILIRLTPEQHKKLRLFLLSPYFNNTVRRHTILEIYDYILKYNSEENHPKLQKQVVFSTFFPDLTFVENQKSQLDSLTSDLYALTKQFLGQLKKDKDDTTEYLAMLEFYRLFGLEDRFWATVDTFKKEIDKEPYRDADYYQKKHLVDMEITTFVTSSNTFQDDANLLSYNMNLDIWYAINKLQVLSAIKMQKRVATFADISNQQIFNLISELAQSDENISIPVIKIFKLVSLLIDDPTDDVLLNQFKFLLEQHEYSITQLVLNDQLMPYLRYFVGYRSLQASDKNQRFNTFLLYKSHYEKGYFFTEGSIQITNLLVLVQMALRNNDAEWALQLLNNHPPKKIFGTRYAEEAYNLLWADYYFNQKNHDAAIEKIEMRLFENPIYSIMADILVIKIYFDQQNELLDFRMKALDQKVRRSKMSVPMKERYFNFLKKLDKINKNRFVPSKDKQAKLLEEIKTIKNIYERDWLVEKIGESEKVRK